MNKIILFFTLCLISLNLFANDIIVVYAKGDVRIVSIDQVETKALKGTQLFEGHRILTGDNSFVILKIENHSVHRIEENSDILVSSLPYNFKDSKEVEEGGSFYLKLGTIFTEVTEKSDTETFKIETKNSSMGVRGTKFMVSKADENENAWVSVNEGVIEIENSASGEQDFILQNQSMVIENDKTFTKQKAYEWQKKLNWKIENTNDSSQTFRKIRKSALLEFSKNRSKWTRNEVLYQQKKKEWKQKQERWKERTQKLEVNPKKIERQKRLKENLSKGLKNTKMKKSTRELYQGALSSEKKTNRNSFANRKKMGSMSEDELNRKRMLIDRLKEKRRRTNLPMRPEGTPISSPINSPATNTTPIGGVSSDGTSTGTN